MLQKLCGDGLREFVALAGGASDGPGDAFEAFAGFLRKVVAADLHALTVRLGGTFVSTDELRELAVDSAGLVDGMVRRASATGRLRRGFVASDVPLLLEQVTAIQVDDPRRTGELRLRALELALLGLDVTTSAERTSPGDPPTARGDGRTLATQPPAGGLTSRDPIPRRPAGSADDNVSANAADRHVSADADGPPAGSAARARPTRLASDR